MTDTLTSNQVNTARIIRAGATAPEICMHNVKLGQGCFCPHCPTACFGEETAAVQGSAYERGWQAGYAAAYEHQVKLAEMLSGPSPEKASEQECARVSCTGLQPGEWIEELAPIDPLAWDLLKASRR